VPAVHAIPHVGVAPEHVAVPFPLVGPGHTVEHPPQWSGSVGAKHVPLQSSVVVPSHTTLHVPVVHCAIPIPASGPAHTFVHDPQWFGSVCSFTHTPLQSTVPASQLGPASAGALSLIEPSVAGPLSALTLPSGEPESLPPPESTVVIDESPVPPSASPSTLASPPPPPQVLLSAHVPNVSVPHPAAHMASPVNPTHRPSVTA
jgi:hypothetical protein